jgi:hypothetical protein
MPPKHYVVVEPGSKFDLSVGDQLSEKAKRQAVAAYADFVKMSSDTYDYGTGELSFSEPEKLKLNG